MMKVQEKPAWLSQTTRVGDDDLPELPPGWPVAVDTEGSGLYPDGDPIPAGSRAAQPEARVSVVSVSFRWPNEDGTPGDVRDFAWPFDQGPILGKPTNPIKDPETGVCTFATLDEAQQAKLLLTSSKVLDRVVTMADAAPNLPSEHYARLIAWLDRRDDLTMHNANHDKHTFRAGLREGAGGDPRVRDGYLAWDPDSEPGTWVLGLEPSEMPGMWVRTEPQRIHMMEPTAEPLQHGDRRRTIWCTLITQKQLIDPLKPAALKKTGTRLWGEDESQEAEALAKELSKQGTGLTKRYDLLPWCGAMGRYAAKDTSLTFRLREYQEELVELGAVLPKFWELHEKEHELQNTLYRMERRGVAYSAKESYEEGAKLRRANRELAARLPFDPTKPSEVKRYYYGPVCPFASSTDGGSSGVSGVKLCPPTCTYCEGKNGLGLEPLDRTDKTKAPKLDIVEMRKLVEENQPWAREYMDWTKRRNSDSKWYTGWAARTGRDGRIRTQYKQCRSDIERPGMGGGGTVSGRLAVTRWQSQAIPHGKLIPEGAVPVRRLIGNTPATPSRPARVLYEHDLAAGEVRVVTVVANSTLLWDALDAGQDTHALNCKALFGVNEDHPDWDNLRSAAKRGTFGILYGGGVKAVHEQMEAASGMKFKQSAVAAAKESFFKTYPEFKRLTQQAEAKVTRWMGGCGYLTMLDGWRRWYDPKEKTNSAVNQIIQGNLARAMINWMTAVEREIPDCLLLQIHDSLVTEHDDTPEGAAEAQRVSDIGEREFRRYFAVRGRVMAWGIKPERWDKKS